MALVPGAIDRRLPEVQATLNPVYGLIFHSIVGSAQAAYNKFRYGSNLESNFIVPKNGELWQLMEDNERADANLNANRTHASVETEDNGDPNTDPWTDAQLHTLARLGVYYVRLRAVPVQVCPSPTGKGFGYHTMWGAPSAWTPVAKSCPGVIRIHQFYAELYPAIVAGVYGNLPVTEDQELMAAKDEILAAVKASQDNTNQKWQDLVNRLKTVNDNVKVVREAVQVKPNGT